MNLKNIILILFFAFINLYSQNRAYSLGSAVEDFDININWPNGTSDRTSIYELIDQNKIIVLFFGSPG